VITSTGDNGSVSLFQISMVTLKILAFIFGSLILGHLAVPWLINHIAKTGNYEVLLLVTLGLGFGLAVVAHSLGFSMAIGAFIMGVIIASTRSSENNLTLVSPIRDMFAAIFFISMGALIDITQFREFLLPAMLVTVLMIIGKMVGCGVGTRLFKYDGNTSLKVGLGMSQIGEFAFIVMKVGQDAGLISSFLYPTVGVAAAITTFMTPYLIRTSYRIDINKIKIPWIKRR
jgi:monovalent cation:H+ antiporter-2, CPA2 family